MILLYIIILNVSLIMILLPPARARPSKVLIGSNYVTHKEHIANREDLMTAILRISYEVAKRTGKLYLGKFCTVNYDGCIRLFTDIDKEVKRIEVFSGETLDGVYWREGHGKGEWQLSGFPVRE